MNIRHSFKKFKGDYLQGRPGREKGMVNGARFVLVWEKRMRLRMGKVGFGLEMEIREKGVRIE